MTERTGKIDRQHWVGTNPPLTTDVAPLNAPPPVPAAHDASPFPEIPEKAEEPSLARTMVQPAKWAVVGFAVGLVLWNVVTIWHDVDEPVVFRSPTSQPSSVELASRDAAVTALNVEYPKKDQAALPTDQQLSAEKENSQCVVLELQRDENRVNKKPCPAEKTGWETTSTASN